MNILYGICGIGLGHTHRQRPILDELVKEHTIAIFAYGDALTFYQSYFDRRDNVKVIPVAVPDIVGDENGLNFEKSAKHPANQQNFTAINMQAFSEAQAFIGKPDIVMTDYEPNSAQYAYMYNAPLITLDQQSKYLVGDFPETINGHSNKDEIERLRLFFPKAAKRVVFSFFDVPVKDEYKQETIVLPPILRNSLQGKERNIKAGHYMVYISAQAGFKQSLSEIISICQQCPNKTFSLYHKDVQEEQQQGNVTLYPHGHKSFDDSLLSCEKLICTAGHSLLSEAVALGIPLITIPMDIYEQQMNAHMVEENGWGERVNFIRLKTP